MKCSKIIQKILSYCVSTILKLYFFSVSNSFKLSVDFKNNKMEFFYDPFKRQNSMKTCRKKSACGKIKKNDSHLVVPGRVTNNVDFRICLCKK